MSKKRHKKTIDEDTSANMTMAELDSLIAERYATMPKSLEQIRGRIDYMQAKAAGKFVRVVRLLESSR